MQDIGLRRSHGLSMHQYRFGKPVAFKQTNTKCRKKGKLLGGFDFLGDQPCLRLCLGQLDERGHRFRLEHRNIELDKSSKWKPVLVGASQNRVVKGKSKTALAHVLQAGQPGFYLIQLRYA